MLRQFRNDWWNRDLERYSNANKIYHSTLNPNLKAFAGRIMLSIRADYPGQAKVFDDMDSQS